MNIGEISLCIIFVLIIKVNTLQSSYLKCNSKRSCTDIFVVVFGVFVMFFVFFTSLDTERNNWSNRLILGHFVFKTFVF